MKIKIKREGGFIGITSKANLEFDELTIEEQNALNKLAEESLKTDSPKEDCNSSLETAPIIETSSRDLKAEQAEAETRGLILVEPTAKGDEKVGTEIIGSDNIMSEKPILAHKTQAEPPNMPHNMGMGSMMRDGFNYSISMKKNGKTVSLKFDDMTAPPEIVEIFQKYVQY